MKIRCIWWMVAIFAAANTFAASLPTLSCPALQVLEITSTNGAFGAVRATVQDADGDPLMVVWLLNGHPIRTNILRSRVTTNAIVLTLTHRFAPGTNDVTIAVTDDGTNVVHCTSLVIVRDTIPPVIRSISATPRVLWPPNHRMVPITLAVRALDSGGPVRWRIADIQCNEAEDARGSGHTAPDYLITGPHQALLRAERAGPGHGRIYTLIVEATDLANNSCRGQVRVFVPHDRGQALPRAE